MWFLFTCTSNLPSMLAACYVKEQYLSPGLTVHPVLFQMTERTLLFFELRVNSIISCTGFRIPLVLSLLVLKPFISRDSCKVSIQGFCFFWFIFLYTRISIEISQPHSISDLTLSNQTDLSSLRAGLDSIPGYGSTRAELQSNPSTESQGDAPRKVAAGHASPLNSPPFELLTPLLFLTEGLLWVHFVFLRKSCPCRACRPCRWHGSGWHGAEICRQYWKLSSFFSEKKGNFS